MAEELKVDKNGLVMVPLDRIKEKFSTTRSVFDHLVTECDYFLPKFDFVNMTWLKSVWCGKSRVKS